MEDAVLLTQKQCACLLAAAFLCTFPHRNKTTTISGQQYPSVNFHALFAGDPVPSPVSARCLCAHTMPDGVGWGGWALQYSGQIAPRQAAKLRCIIHYFERVTTDSTQRWGIQTRRKLNGAHCALVAWVCVCLCVGAQ